MAIKKRASFTEKRRNELEIHKRAWHTRWAKYGRHIERPLSQISDPKERAAAEAKLREEAVTAEAKIEQFRHDFFNRPGRRAPKGMEAEDLADPTSGLYDPQLAQAGGEGAVGIHGVSEAQTRARLMEELPFYATHGHFSDEVSEGRTASTGPIGSHRAAYSQLLPAERANYNARAAQYLDFESRLHRLKSAETISTGEIVTGFQSEEDKKRGGHLWSESKRRKLSKREKHEMERIADRVTKTQYRDLEPSDLPYVTEKTAPNIKRTLHGLLEKPSRTGSHVRLTERETRKNIERTVKQALGKTFDHPEKQADREELIDTIKEATFGMPGTDRMQLLAHTAHEMEQNYVRAMLPTATPEDRRRFKASQKRYKAIKAGEGLFSQEEAKAKAKAKAHRLIGRLGLVAENEVESDRQAREITRLMSGPEQQAYVRGKSRTLTPKQKSDLALGVHQWAIQQGVRSPFVDDLRKKLGHEPSMEEKAKALGIEPEKKGGRIVKTPAEILNAREEQHSPRQTFDDPRTLGRRSVEHTYRMWGHADTPLLQGWLRHSMTDKDRKKFLAGKGAEKTGPIQLIPPALKTQWAFHREQQRNRAYGLLSGNASWGLQNNKPISINQRNVNRVAFGMIPNSKFIYQLRNRDLTSSRERKAPFDLEVPGYDLRPIGDIAPGTGYTENDFISKPIETRLQEERFNYARGAKEPVHPHNRSITPFVSDTVYVPVVGAKGESKTVADPKGGKEKAYFELTARHAGPREGSGWGASQETRISQQRYDMLPNDAKDTRDVTKSIQYVFLDPSELRLKDKEINKASVALPEKKLKNLKIGDRLLFANLPMQDTRRDKVLAPYFEARAQREYEEKAAHAADLAPRLQAAFPPAGRTDLEFGYVPEVQKELNRIYRPAEKGALPPMNYDILGPSPVLTGERLKDIVIDQNNRGRSRALQEGGFQNKTELEILAAAAGASAFYKLQKSAKRGVLHKGYEKSAQAAEKTRFYQKNKDRWSLPQFKSDIDRAYITPGDAFLLDMSEKAKHPLTSTTATTLGGLNIETPYYRKHWINPETRELRSIQKESNRLHDIVRAQDYALDHVNDTGVFGAIRRHRAKGYLRHNIVKNFNTLEDPKQGVKSTLGESTRFARMYKDNDFVRESHPANHSGETFHVTAPMKKAAGGLLKEIGELREHSYVRQGLGALGQPDRSSHFSSRLMHGDLTHGEEAVIVGGAVAATALGAAYLYHRHKQKQKEEAERMSFYNKMLPPAFDVRVPKVEANAWYKTGNGPIMSEIPGAANRRIPVRFGVHLKKKHVALRPMDRPRQLDTKYDANLPLGVAGFRVGVRPRGGSLKKSLTTELQHPLTRNFKTATHEAVVAGRRIPFTLEDQKKITLSRTNPNRLSNKDRDEIINATIGSPDEEAVRRFYSYGKVDPIIEMMNDPEELRRIGAQKGKPELEKIAMQQMRRAQGPVSRPRRRERAAMGQTGRYY